MNPADFPVQNLPYGVFSVAGGPRHAGVALGDRILDLTTLGVCGGLFASGNLESLIAAGPEVWSETRHLLTETIEGGDLHDHLVPMTEAVLHLPCPIGNYVDFFSSLEHAANTGRILRPDTEPLTPNWRRLPIGYHGRARSIVIDGVPVRRPHGQRGPGDFGPTRRLDFELEVGFITGPGLSLGTPVTASAAESHIFGLVLVNDWSARDIQAWEAKPLGPFLGKSFATTISPWVVPLAALAPHRVDPPPQHPPPLPYLTPAGKSIDLHLEAAINGTVVTRTNYRHLYWTMSQQLAHATSNGANFGPGDLFASGTVSGPTPDSRGCLLEITENGQTGEYLRDGDTVTLTAWAGGDGQPRIGFGTCSGTVVA
ncbi:MAG TPA: fumarylacetoacetase [Acidimicrobiia bacterium]|nr:fumarylacetoacetase [Acidimicrobiia bacterium]